MTKPLISVILVAHDRRQYITKALESIEAQTADKGLYEIVVVKFFSNAYIDRLLESRNCISIISKEVNLGAKLSQAVNVCHGDVLVFMEDDDLFKPNKLDKIVELFKLDECVSYYHDSQEAIGGDGVPIRNKAFNKTKTTLSVNLSNNRSVLFPFRLIPAAGVSSITIRKSIVIPYLEKLSSLKKAVDLFLFLLAIAEGKTMIIDSMSMTQLRVHDSATHITAGLYDFLSFKCKVEEEYKEDLMVIFETFRPYFGKKEISYYGFKHNVTAAIACGFNRKTVFQYVIDAIKYLRPIHSTFFGYFVLLSVIYLVSRKASALLYYVIAAVVG